MIQGQSIGKFARTLLGPRLFAIVGKIYRSIFIDVKAFINILDGQIPQNAHVLDIGGGDGHLVNLLLVRRKDIRVTMIDIASDIGGGLHPENRRQVRLLPSTPLHAFNSGQSELVDFIIVSDVIHHIAQESRANFISDIKSVSFGREALLLVKDVEPNSFISMLGYFSDRYISNDKNVKLVSQSELKELIHGVFRGKARLQSDAPNLINISPPNYTLTFKIHT